MHQVTCMSTTASNVHAVMGHAWNIASGVECSLTFSSSEPSCHAYGTTTPAATLQGSNPTSGKLQTPCIGVLLPLEHGLVRRVAKIRVWARGAVVHTAGCQCCVVNLHLL
eukprot:365052-Chlamydomonas_euryale.AAC.26